MKILHLVFIRWKKIRSYTEKIKYPLCHLDLDISYFLETLQTNVDDSMESFKSSVTIPKGIQRRLSVLNVFSKAQPQNSESNSLISSLGKQHVSPSEHTTADAILETSQPQTSDKKILFFLIYRGKNDNKVKRWAMIRNWYNQIPYPALKTKREITKYIIDSNLRKARAVNRMNSSFPDRWSFSCLNLTKICHSHNRWTKL